jgi:Glycerophosphoryl diester phosphodiesterase
MSQLVIGHRGAAGYRPEHTLASCELSIRLGADVIEPDLVTTGDGVLVARHEPEISGTTDVARHPEFAHRRTTRTVDGAVTTGWFTDDFTLRELRTLRAVERIPRLRPHSALYDGRDRIPTLQEVVDLVRRASREHGRPVGIAPETEAPDVLPGAREAAGAGAGAGCSPAPGSTGRTPGVYVQSFEVANLVALRSRLRVDLVQLTAPVGAPWDFVAAGDPRTYADLVTPSGLRQIARYAEAVGPDRTQIVPRDGPAPRCRRRR